MRVLAAWLDHWDAREQNSMDVWLATDPSDKRSSPGHVVHYVLDTSDTLGGEVSIAEMSRRLGYAYNLDFAEIGRALITLGAEERPWDHAREQPGREKFGYFRAGDFDPPGWKPMYPNPAFQRMTERDAAWMARLIARFSPDDVRRFVALGKWQDPSDADYLTGILLERQHRILARYLGKLSPLGELRAAGRDRICATDFARLRQLAAPASYHYSIVELGPGGAVCFATTPVVTGALPDADPGRIVQFEIDNGSRAGPLVVWAYDLGQRGMQLAGVTRPEP
jgi:hypothetical protein